MIDSSASLKWWLDDEEYVAEAREILKQIHAGRIIPVVPDIWHYEIANGIRTAVNPLSPLLTESRMETVNEYQKNGWEFLPTRLFATTPLFLRLDV